MIYRKLTVIILLSLYISQRNSYADALHLFTGGFSNSRISNLTFKVSSTVSSNYKDAIIKPASNNWNNISTKVKVVETNAGSYDVIVYVVDTVKNGLFGEIRPYYFKTPEYSYVYDSCACNTWSYVELYGYENQMTAYKFSQAEKISNFTHEFGHALSLAHTNDLSTSSVMKSGKQAIGPQPIDKDHLRQKWGQ